MKSKSTLHFQALLLATVIPFVQGCVGAQQPVAPNELGLTLRGNLLIYKNNPLHPRLVQKFIGDLADSEPVVVSVDISAAMPSNEFAEVPEVRGDLIRCVNGFSGENDTFTYRKLGSLSNGINVLWTQWNGGGTGQFDTLVLVRFRVGRAYDLNASNAQLHVFMDFRGLVALGDRDDGTIQVQPDKIVIGCSRYRRKTLEISPEE